MLYSVQVVSDERMQDSAWQQRVTKDGSRSQEGVGGFILGWVDEGN